VSLCQGKENHESNVIQITVFKLKYHQAYYLIKLVATIMESLQNIIYVVDVT